MPYDEQELLSNEHYTSLKTRDEIAYNQEFISTRDKWSNRGGQYWDSLRDKEDVIQLYEDPQTGNSHDSQTQSLRIWIYQRRYRTNAATKDILDRQFKEF